MPRKALLLCAVFVPCLAAAALPAGSGVPLLKVDVVGDNAVLSWTGGKGPYALVRHQRGEDGDFQAQTLLRKTWETSYVDAGAAKTLESYIYEVLPLDKVGFPLTEPLAGFLADPPPIIGVVANSEGRIVDTVQRGEAVQILGDWFDSIPQGNMVHFKTRAGFSDAPASFGNRNTLEVQVPQSAVSGSVYVTGPGGKNSNDIFLKVSGAARIKAALAPAATSSISISQHNTSVIYEPSSGPPAAARLSLPLGIAAHRAKITARMAPSISGIYRNGRRTKKAARCDIIRIEGYNFIPPGGPEAEPQSSVSFYSAKFGGEIYCAILGGNHRYLNVAVPYEAESGPLTVWIGPEAITAVQHFIIEGTSRKPRADCQGAAEILNDDKLKTQGRLPPSEMVESGKWQ